MSINVLTNVFVKHRIGFCEIQILIHIKYVAKNKYVTMLYVMSLYLLCLCLSVVCVLWFDRYCATR